VRDPANLCRETLAGGHGLKNASANVRGPADPSHEFGLHHPWNAQRGGGEDYAERGEMADEEVLFIGLVHVFESKREEGWTTF